MKASESPPMLLRMIRVIVLIDLGVFLVVGLICFLIGWRTLPQYGDALIRAGLVGLLLILIIGAGGNLLRAAGDNAGSPSDPARRESFDMRAVHQRGERALFFLAGFIAIVIVMLMGSALMGAG